MRRKFEVKKMIQRNYYLDRLIRNMWNGEIKVITGIRRCGKSVLLFELFDEYLRNHGTDAAQIIKIELDQRRYYKYRNPITLCEYVEHLVLGQQDHIRTISIPASIIAALRHSDSFIANLTKQQPTGQRVAFCVMQCWGKFEGVPAYIFK